MGPVCYFCEGRGKRERFVVSMRRIALVRCEKCDGTGHQPEAPVYPLEAS